jgi:hypothetical protein
VQTPSGGDALGYLMRHGVDGPVTRIDAPGADDSGAFANSDRGRIIGLYGPPSTPRAMSAAMPLAMPLALPLAMPGM